MSRKVTWKKGMRLSAEIFDAADNAKEESLSLVSMLASAGRSGLFAGPKPFELTLNINDNVLEVASLSCHGVTESGKVIDVEFDSNYSHTFDTRLGIPSGSGADAWLLVLKMHGRKWREVDEMYSESEYTFELQGENTRIDADSLPVGRIVNRYGWRLDETDFVPPCLFVRSHPMYQRQFEEASELLGKISGKCRSSENCVARTFLSAVWPAADNVLITFDKERDMLTPDRLYAGIQQFVNSFVIGCRLDEHINLENPEPFMLYVRKPYDRRNLLQDIAQGLALCAEIVLKVETVCAMTEERRSVPEEPEPEKKPEPQKPVKNRWDGIEI